MQKITPFLWFDTQAEEAANFYTAVFKDGSIGNVVLYPEGAMGPEGSVMVVEFTIMGQNFVALNGGPLFPHSPAISFVVSCEDQDEIDYYWDHLLEGGKPSQCGWLEDKFGVSWQVVPSVLGQLTSGTKEQTKAVMDAVMQMIKLDLPTMRAAFEQAAPVATTA